LGGCFFTRSARLHVRGGCARTAVVARLAPAFAGRSSCACCACRAFPVCCRPSRGAKSETKDDDKRPKTARARLYDPEWVRRRLTDEAKCVSRHLTPPHPSTPPITTRATPSSSVPTFGLIFVSCPRCTRNPLVHCEGRQCCYERVWGCTLAFFAAATRTPASTRSARSSRSWWPSLLPAVSGLECPLPPPSPCCLAPPCL
jgi:hypothetical protein